MTSCRAISLFLFVPLSTLACAGLEQGEPARVVEAPLGVPGDASDRDCQVVLRHLQRPSDGLAGWQTGGGSWVWLGAVDISAEAEASGAVPAIMYQYGSDPSWRQVLAEPADGAPAGFTRYTFRLDEHLPGPGMSATSLSRARVEVIPVLHLPGGGRLFDHNRHPGDFDNYVLDAAGGFAVPDDALICPGLAAPPPIVPGWMGEAVVRLTRASGDACAGDPPSTPLAAGFHYDTWVRTRAIVRNACFEVWAPGVTDWDNPDLWRQLDVRIHHRFGDGPETWRHVNLDRRVGNNARYAFGLAAIDPFRPYHCPDVPVSTDGGYVSAEVSVHFSVNGVTLRPDGPGSTYPGAFSDYAGDPWRAANCGD